MVRNDDGGSVTGKNLRSFFAEGITTPLSSLLWFTTLESLQTKHIRVKMGLSDTASQGARRHLKTLHRSRSQKLPALSVYEVKESHGAKDPSRNRCLRQDACKRLHCESKEG